MKMIGRQKQKKPACRAGFSLLEVLMAITVLIIIVLIIALVFQQSNTAWGAGVRRAGAETTLRSVLGFMERDLVHAVDTTTQFGTGPLIANQFPSFVGPGTIQFMTLDGTNRTPIQVQYAVRLANGAYNIFRATRTVEPVPNSTPTNWQPTAEGWLPAPVDAGDPAGACLNGSQPMLAFKFHTVTAPPEIGSPGLPLRVEIEAHVRKDATLAVVSGSSLGRNRPTHPEDRIIVSP